MVPIAGQALWHPRLLLQLQNRLTSTAGPAVRQLIVTICYRSRCTSVNQFWYRDLKPAGPPKDSIDLSKFREGSFAESVILPWLGGKILNTRKKINTVFCFLGSWDESGCSSTSNSCCLTASGQR